MKKSSLLLYLSMALTGTASLAAGHETLAPDEAKKRLSSDTTIILIDVRTPSEYAERHIPGSMLLPLDTLDLAAAQALPDKNRTIFVYCRSGHRSRIAAEKLDAMGYTKVFDIGGIINWPYETATGKKQGQ